MTTAPRPRRSMLYMPGSNPRALDKARGLAADALIFDLEDAVAPDAKATARGVIAEAVAAGGYGQRELIVRSNRLDTAWGHGDLAAAAQMAIHGVLLPKVESAATVRQAAAILDKAGAPPELAIWCMMETPMGLLHAEEIAASHPRLAGFVMGTSDLANDLHARHTRDRLPMLTGLSLCLLAARAYGLAVMDGVYLDLADDEGFADACRQGVELGFDGKTLIHPKTIAAANAAFGPSPAEIEQARKQIAGFEAAEAEGKAVVLVDGKLVENLHVASARRLLALVARIAELEAGA
jgi:citrate lyase subunit beta / citryl-CoA lyase